MIAQIIKNPFATAENLSCVECVEGQTIRDIVNAHIDPKYHSYLQIFLNDLSVSDKDIVLKCDDRLTITAIPKGQGNGKDNLRIGLTIAVMVIATIVSNGVAGTAAGKIGGALAGAAVSVGGVLAINALLPIKTPAMAAAISQMDTPTYQVTGGQNQAAPWGTVPTVLGKMRVAPFLGAQSYYQNNYEGTRRDLVNLYIWGYGAMVPLWDINPQDDRYSLRIGNNRVKDYDSITSLTRIAAPGDNDFTIYKGTVISQHYGIELLSGNEIINTTADFSGYEKDIDIEIDVSFPGGLFDIDPKGSTVSKMVIFGVKYKRSEETTWTTIDHPWGIPQQRIFVANSSDFNGWKSLDIDESGIISVAEKDPTNLYHFRAKGTPADYRPQAWKDAGYFNFLYLDKILPQTPPFYPWLGQTYAVIGAGELPSRRSIFSNATKQQLNYTIEIKSLPPGKYDIAITRVTDQHDFSRSRLEAIRVRTQTPPLNFPYSLTTTELRAKASEQVNGVINTLTGVIQTVAPVYKNGMWQELREPTSNPASLILEVLTGDCNPMRISTDLIDMDNFAEFYIHCDENGFEYNRYHSDKMDLKSVISDIAAAGRGFVGQPDGKYYIYIDKIKTATQLFNSDNIIKDSFSSKKLLAKLPHALRCTFINEFNDYKSDERIVYFDGYSDANATLFESMDFPYITHPDLIYRFAREYMKAVSLRSEEHTFRVSYDILLSKRRDRVHLASDVLQVGLNYGSIRSVNADSISLYEPVIFEADKEYVIDVRIKDSDEAEYKTVTLDVLNPTSESKTITLNCDTSALTAGDLYTFSEKGKAFEECIITNIIIGEDLTATVTCVPYAKEIYSDPADPIPPHTPIITPEQADPFSQPPAPHFVSLTESIAKEGGIVMPLLIVNWSIEAYPLQVYYELDVKTPYASTWQSLGEIKDTSYSFKGYEYGRYTFRIRAVNDNFVASNWVEISELLHGLSLPLADVAGVTSRLQADFRQILTWDYIDDFRDVVYEVRRGDVWEKSEIIAVTDLNFISLNFNGQYWVKGKLRKESIYSVTPAGLLVESSDLLTQNVIASFEESPTWGGQKDFCSVINTRLVFNASEQETYYAIYTIAPDHLISLSAQGSCNIKVDFTAHSSIDYNFYNKENIYSLENIYGIEAAGKYSITPQLSVDGGDWQDFIAGMYAGQYFNFRLYIEVDDPDVDIEISNFSFAVDVPDRVETFYNHLIPSGALLLAFTPAFNAPPTVVVNILNAQEGDTVILSESSKESVYLRVTNAGLQVERHANIIIQGY